MNLLKKRLFAVIINQYLNSDHLFEVWTFHRFLFAFLSFIPLSAQFTKVSGQN